MAKNKWQNWSGAVQCEPKEILFPNSEEAIVQIVRKAIKENKKIRVVGTGHSFTSIVHTNEMLISLDELQGIIKAEPDQMTATVWAGTKIKRLGGLIYAHGMAQENLGDVDVQSIAGSIMTGTHGTGIEFGNLATQVLELTFVNGHGELVTCSANHQPDLFKAAQISLGVFGIVTRIKLRLEPAYNLEIEMNKSTIQETLQNLDQYNESYRNFEFYSFPYTDTAQHRKTNKTDKPAKKDGLLRYYNEIIMENGLFWLFSYSTRLFPSLSKPIAKMVAKASTKTIKTHHSHKIYATTRMVRFQEMEYNVPYDAYKEVVRDMRKQFDQAKYQVHFPIENRFVKGDDIWLSPAYKRKSAYIAVHVFKGKAYKKYFEDMEAIFKAYDGRPHWGKMHFQTPEELASIYPKWNEFLAQRNEQDPKQIFINDYLKSLFGL